MAYNRQQAIQALDEIEAYAATWTKDTPAAVQVEEILAKLIAHNTVLARVVRALVEESELPAD